MYKWCLGFVLLDSRDVVLRDYVPRTHVLLQALVDANILLCGNLVLGLVDAFLKAVQRDFIHKLGGIRDGELLADLLLKLCFDLLCLVDHWCCSGRG